jgi:HEAT repeat protein
MTRFYCPKCWRDFAEDHEICPECDFNIRKFYTSNDYFDKLIQALKSPEPTTPVRVAMVLGKIKDTRAVQPLIECVKNSEDVFIIREAVRALGEIGTMNAMMFLRTIREHPSKMISNEVQSILDKLYKQFNYKA